MKKAKKLHRDPNQRAYEIVRMSTEESEEEKPQKESPQKEEPSPERSPISKYLAEIGRKGGLKGGPARNKKLSAKRRSEISRKAAESRWKKQKS